MTYREWLLSASEWLEAGRELFITFASVEDATDDERAEAAELVGCFNDTIDQAELEVLS